MSFVIDNYGRPVTFVELPDGQLLNPINITRVVPLSSGSLRIHYIDGSFTDVQEEYAQGLRRDLGPPQAAPPKRKTKTQQSTS